MPPFHCFLALAKLPLFITGLLNFYEVFDSPSFFEVTTALQPLECGNLPQPADARVYTTGNLHGVKRNPILPGFRYASPRLQPV